MQLLIRTTTCKPVNLAVVGSDTFDLVMAKIKEMAHECTVRDCSYPPSILAKTLLCIRTATGKGITMEVVGSDTFDLVKAKIEDISSLDNRDIHWELIPRPAVWWRGAMPIFVRILDGETISVALGPGHRIDRLETTLMYDHDICPGNQNLFFAGMRLEIVRTLPYYNIVGGSTLDLVLKGPGVAGDTKIHVETIDGKKFPLIVNEDLLIKEVKGLIQKEVGVLIEEQKLLYVEELLEDDRFLRTYNINWNATFVLADDASMKRRVPMRIHVQMAVSQKTIDLDVGSTDTVHVVKAKIQSQEGIPTDRQVLFLPNKQLHKDDFTLAEYFIRNESTIYLALLLGKTLHT